MNMRRGNLDRLIQFRRATMVDDGHSTVEVFSDHGAPEWANKKDVSDAERFRASEVSATITTRFVVRWSPFTNDITTKDRITYEGREYNITGIKEGEGRRRWIEITAAAENDG